MAEARPKKRPVPRVYRLAVLAGGLTVLAACGMVAGIDGLEIGECKGGICIAEGGSMESSMTTDAEGGSPVIEGGTFDGAGLPCPSPHGPTMVRVGTTTNNFCIDSTEVTVAQYREFTTAVGADGAGQPNTCKWNVSYTAGFGGPDDIPVAGIDWC